jgi:hypothetical protein
MRDNYLHHSKDWPDLLRILEAEMGILANLIEKDYWIMHVFYGFENKYLSLAHISGADGQNMPLYQ